MLLDATHGLPPNTRGIKFEHRNWSCNVQKTTCSIQPNRAQAPHGSPPNAQGDKIVKCSAARNINGLLNNMQIVPTTNCAITHATPTNANRIHCPWAAYMDVIPHRNIFVFST